MDSRVDLPAPLGPMIEVTPPGMVQLTSSTTVAVP
jgi:hypothetical protein